MACHRNLHVSERHSSELYQGREGSSVPRAVVCGGGGRDAYKDTGDYLDSNTSQLDKLPYLTAVLGRLLGKTV